MSKERKNLVKKLDELTSRITRLREKSCVTCGSKVNLSNSHIFSRGRMSVRWDISPSGNCHTQCITCNGYYSSTSMHPYLRWYLKEFGMTKFDELERTAKSVVKISESDLANMVKQYEAILHDMEEKERGEHQEVTKKDS